MSENSDDEKGTILTEETPEPDESESNTKKPTKTDSIQWETNTEETPDSEW